MFKQKKPPSRMLLYPLHPWFMILFFLMLFFPIFLLILLFGGSAELWFLAGGLYLLSIVLCIVDYFRYHVTADEKGINVIRWNRVTQHIEWDQVIGCRFGFRGSFTGLICQCGEETCRVPSMLTARHRRFLRLYADPGIIPP